MILVIDNYDSFTYNLVQYLGVCGVKTEVFRNDKITVDEISQKKYDGILLSPGPCTPQESKVCLNILAAALDPSSAIHGVPLFGVCLGHQAIGQVSGATVSRAHRIMHGKASMVEHDNKGLLRGMPNPFRAIRYHSLIVEEQTIPEGFVVTSRSTDDGLVMGVRHESLPIEGVQYHPESILTQDGMKIIENFVAQTTLVRS